jgi:hypothetical protein
VTPVDSCRRWCIWRMVSMLHTCGAGRPRGRGGWGQAGELALCQTNATSCGKLLFLRRPPAFRRYAAGRRMPTLESL